MQRRCMEKRKKRKLLGIAEAVLVVLWILILIWITYRLFTANKVAREEHAAQKEFQSISLMPTPLIGSKSNIEPEIQPVIASLMNQNTDAIGILRFEGDRSLYVCQTTDNSYYMTHRFDRSEDPAGMIFMDFRCSLWPRSDNLVLYGHNMRDGSRFGTLKRFEKKEYIIKYPVFQLIDRYEIVYYVPFAIFHTVADESAPNYFAYDQIDFSTKEEFEQYVNGVKLRSDLSIPIEVTYGDQLLTLVTCDSRIDHGRLIIVCREVKDNDGLHLE